ncbi:MAG: DUF721 domain-containing protein [Synergistetes bacterium]|nr:DUF721 domain-containing protein [Synergistota bacterium]MDW8191772.1 DUF721 domain-containing protein [Synergistota bacterium]
MEKLGSIIDNILRQHKKRIEKERIKIEWPKLVGEDLARRTQPLELKDGCLEVAVPDGAWAKEFQLREEKFLDMLKGYDINKIRFFPMPKLFLGRKV